MNILPQQLRGKTITDCYESSDGKVIIEFNDGYKMKVKRKKKGPFGGVSTGSQIYLEVFL